MAYIRLASFIKLSADLFPQCLVNNIDGASESGIDRTVVREA